MKFSKYSLVSFFTAVAIVTSGCGGGGGGDSTTTTEQTDTTQTDDTTLDYRGNSSLTGTIEGTSTNAAPALAPALASSATTPTELIKLYVLDENGDMVDINITCDISSGKYTCDGIADGEEYIVRYLKKLDDNKTFELKASATIPKGATQAEAPVSKVTTLITETIVQAVEESLVSLKSVNKETIKNIVEKVKESVETAVITLIQNGTIKLPSDDDLIIAKDINDIQATAKAQTNDPHHQPAGHAHPNKRSLTSSAHPCSPS